MKPNLRHRIRTRLAAAFSLAALLLSAAVSAQAAPAPTGTRSAPLPAQLDQLIRALVSAHPSFPGDPLPVTPPTLTWSGAAAFADRATRKPLTAAAGFRIAS